MKRTCFGCKASSWDKGTYNCDLGYDIDWLKAKPKEQCPKPITNIQLINTKYKGQS